MSDIVQTHIRRPHLVGGSVCTYASCFSNDDKLLCLPCGNSVKLISARTGNQVGLLPGQDEGEDEMQLTAQMDDGSQAASSIKSNAASPSALRSLPSHAGHRGLVTTVFPHPTNRVQLYTASLDGTIKLWDLYDQTCVATYEVKIGSGSEGDKFDRPPIIGMVQGAADLLYLLVDPYLFTQAQGERAESSTAHAAGSSSSAAAASAASPSTSAATVTPVSDRERACRIVLYQVSKRSAFILYKVKDASRLAIDPSKRILAVISGRTLRVYDTLRKRSKSTFKQCWPFNLSTVTFHPNETFLTVGDEKGHLFIVHGYQQHSKQNKLVTSGANDGSSSQGIVTQTLHWHAHRVGAVMFTQDGHYMLSGGEEGVLVIWQLETGTKHFIPRLASTILHMSLSHDGNTYALSMGDNRIKLVSAVTNRVEKVITGLSYSAPSQHAGTAAHLVHNPTAHHAPSSSSSASLTHARRGDDRSRHLSVPFLYSPLHAGWFLNSIVQPGVLQVYDLFSDRHVLDLDLLARNIVSRTEDEASNQPRIEQIALHPKGNKMATIERRSGQTAGGISGVASSIASTSDSIVLKFWEWDSGSSQFLLNTRIDPPHSHATAHLSLATLLWHPHENMVVSIGKDACFKIWRQIKKVAGPNVRREKATEAETKKKRKKKAKQGETMEEEEDDDDVGECYWNCTGVGHYRSYPTSCGAFSADGSLLAVSYGQVLTLWDPYTLTLKNTLLHPSPSDIIRHVAFIPGTALLLTSTPRALYVWNLLSLSLAWSYELRVIGLAVPPYNSQQGERKRENESVSVDGSSSNNEGHFAVMVMTPEDDQPDEEEQEERKEEEKENATTPSPSAPPRRRQTHLLLFSAHNPVPLRAWALHDARLERVRQASGGASFASTVLFAQDSAMARAQSHASGSVPTSLIYVNYKRQLARFDDVFGVGEAKSTTNIADGSLARMATAESEEVSLFEQLYGKAQRLARPTPSALSSTLSSTLQSSPVLTPATSRLSSVLQGPSHILPPPSAMFSTVMDGLLKRNIAQNEEQRRKEEKERERERHSTDMDEMETETEEKKEDAQDADSNQPSSSHPNSTLSLASLDASLLQLDSSADGSLFAWDESASLGPQYAAIIRLMESDEPLIADQKQTMTSKSIANSDKGKLKRKKHKGEEENEEEEKQPPSSAVKHNKKRDAVLSSDANGAEQMEIDDGDRAVATPTAKARGKRSKSKSKA